MISRYIFLFLMVTAAPLFSAEEGQVSVSEKPKTARSVQYDPNLTEKLRELFAQTEPKDWFQNGKKEIEKIIMQGAPA